MKKIKLLIANIIFKRLFKLILAEEILQTDPKTGKIYFQGNPLTREQVESLSKSADSILRSQTWELLVREMTYLANKKMFDESLSLDDLLGGKFMLYTLDVISKKLYNLANLK